MDKARSIKLVYIALQMAVYEYGVSEAFAARVMDHIRKDENWKMVPLILGEWNAMEEGRLDFTKLLNPTIISFRPCGRLFNLYQGHEVDPHPMFAELDDTPSRETKMKMTYRLIYDLLFSMCIPHFRDSETTSAAKKQREYLEHSILFQYDDNIELIHKVEK